VIHGIKFCSKIQNAQNHFKSNRSIGLIVTNPMQLVWVQTDIGSERYRVLFKMTNMQKKGMLTVQSVQSVQMLTWQAIRHVVGAVRHMEGSCVDNWHMTWLVYSEWDSDM
jgi:hypothetical protein